MSNAKYWVHIAAVALVAALAQLSAQQSDTVLREYAGVYRWSPDSYVYLQLWDEFSGFGKPRTLVAFDESGEVRTLYPAGKDAFTTGPGIAVAKPVQSRIRFEHDAAGRIAALTWTRVTGEVRRAARAEIEHRENIRFSNGAIQLAGTVISPATSGRHPAIVLVHGSGAENRDYMVPWAHFLVRHGIAILGYDKRGVDGSTGDWNTATFEDLAGDVVSACAYLKTRSDIDAAKIGILGISQAGWVMPIAATRTSDIAFLVSVSGAGVSPAETTIDETRNELAANGAPAAAIDNVVGLMKLQYDYARTGNGWDAYAAKRAQMVARMGQAPASFPDTPVDPYWESIRRIYFYDPAPTLRRLTTPALGVWGELDNNIIAEKNKSAWDEALRAAGNRDYTLKILSKADHSQWEARTGSNEEMKSLNGFVPEYQSTVRDWIAHHVMR
jgi:pimeloyl-ACP methyl ester carboxylesterase